MVSHIVVFASVTTWGTSFKCFSVCVELYVEHSLEIQNDYIDTDCGNMFYQAFIKNLSNVIYQSYKSSSFSPSFKLSLYNKFEFSVFKLILYIKNYNECETFWETATYCVCV